jgi:hypothetical protein
VPGASQAGAWRTKHSLLTTNYEPKSPSRRAGDQSDEKIVIARGALTTYFIFLPRPLAGPVRTISARSRGLPRSRVGAHMRQRTIVVAKANKSTPTAAAIMVRERVLLFCVTSGTERQHASMKGEAVTTMIVKWSAALSGSTTPRYCHAHR